jgi:hypothetical protein
MYYNSFDRGLDMGKMRIYLCVSHALKVRSSICEGSVVSESESIIVVIGLSTL